MDYTVFFERVPSAEGCGVWRCIPSGKLDVRPSLSANALTSDIARNL